MTDTKTVKTVKTRKKREPAPIPKSILEMLGEIEAVLPDFTKAIFTICISDENCSGGKFSRKSYGYDYTYKVDKENKVLIISKCCQSVSVHFGISAKLNDPSYALVENVHKYFVVNGTKN